MTYPFSWGTMGFNIGTPGSFVRRKHTDYVTSYIINGQTYNYDSDLNIHLRSLPLKQQVFSDVNAANKRAETLYEYDTYTSSSNHAMLINRANISGLESSFTTSKVPRGNITAVTRYADAVNLSGAVTAYAQYDIAGNKVNVIDANNNIMNFDYTDRFGSPDGEAQSNIAPPELSAAGLSSYAFATKTTNALNHVTYTQFDYYCGKTIDTEDQNGIKFSFAYDDPLDRPTKGIDAVSIAAQQRQTLIRYNDDTAANALSDPPHSVTTISDKDTYLESNSGTGLKATAFYDGLGRTWRKASFEGGGNWSVTETQFDALGRAYQGSNPFRVSAATANDVPAAAAAYVGKQWTTSTFDALGRVTQVLTSDGAAVTSIYACNQVTVTDQAGKVRRSLTDALGNLTTVIEDPNGLNYSTTYQYDTLNNLAKVTQGTQQRYFMYDSLSRLLRAKNPEQAANSAIALADPLTGNSAWSMAYAYDNNGNLVTKTDANNLITTNTYDALNRNIYIRYNSYVNGISAVDLVYDYATNGKGKLNYTVSYNTRWDADSKPYWHADVIAAYDVLGRPTNKWQGFILSNASNQATTWQQYNLSATYNLAGQLTSETYPSSKIVNYAYDTVGRTTSFTGNLGDNVARNYATGMTYDAASMLTYEVFGSTSNLYHKQKFNSRHQLYDVRLSSISGVNDTMRHGALQFFYDGDAFEGIHNNGNVIRADSWAMKTDGSGAWMAQYDRYAYDGVNRLWNLYESGNNSSNTADVFRFQQRFTFDQWGNRSIDLPNTTISIPGLTRESCVIDQSTNRMTQRNGLPMTYDVNGNQTNDGSYARWYDGENKLSKANSNGGLNYYYYNATGSRS